MVTILDFLYLKITKEIFKKIKLLKNTYLIEYLFFEFQFSHGPASVVKPVSRDFYGPSHGKLALVLRVAHGPPSPLSRVSTATDDYRQLPPLSASLLLFLSLSGL